MRHNLGLRLGIAGILIVVGAAAALATFRPTAPMAPNPESAATPTVAQAPALRQGQGSAPDARAANPARPGPQNPFPACPTDIATPLFDTLPVDAGDFIAFRPLGFLSPPIHMFPAKHSAFSMALPGQKAMPKPVRAPGKVFVAEIWEATFSTGGANYQVFVYPCREVRVYFGHLATLSPKLADAMKTSQPKCNSFVDGTATVTTCRHENLSLALESGEAMGAGPDTAGIDFGVIDFRSRPAAFVMLEHYDSFYPYYASPIEYFTPGPRTVLEAKTGHVFGARWRTAEPIGGTYAQDIPGTAQGNWFLLGLSFRNSTDPSPFLGLAHDYVDPTQPMMAIGSSVKGLTMGLYSYSVQRTGLTNRDFADVAADGKTYCFDQFLQGQSQGGLPLRSAGGAVLLTLPSAITLKVEFVPGTACANTAGLIFTANAALFER